MDNISEEVLDNILELLEENRKAVTENDNEKNYYYWLKRGIKPPLNLKEQRIRHTHIKGTGKPASEMIIEDRR